MSVDAVGVARGVLALGEWAGTSLVSVWVWLDAAPTLAVLGPLTRGVALAMAFHAAFLFIWRFVALGKVGTVTVVVAYAVLLLGLVLWRLEVLGLSPHTRIGAVPGTPSEVAGTATSAGRSLTTARVVLVLMLASVASYILIVMVRSLRTHAAAANLLLLLSAYVWEYVTTDWTWTAESWLVVSALAIVWVLVAIPTLGVVP